MPRRPHPKSSTLLLLILFILAPQSLPKAVPAPAARQHATARRPLRMLALGDSVMWGQGLLDRNKFTYRLRDWLCAQRGGTNCADGGDVQLHVEAHSGAVVSRPGNRFERKQEEEFTRAVAPLKFAGEVNHGYPTLWGQLELARRHYQQQSVPLSEVDLVLVNGGINDMGASRLLVNRLVGGDVRRMAKQYCGDEMKRFLLEVADAFPNARVVVPGYFPLVSESTPPFILFETIKEWLFGGERAEARLFRAFQEDWAAAAGPARTTRTMRQLAERSREFVTASNEALADAVAHLNRRRPLPTSAAGAAAPAAAARGFFAAVPFGPDNTYAAPRTFLWRLGRKSPTLALQCADDNFITRFVVDDEVQAERPCMCRQAGRRDDPVCFRAGAFHPNREGAAAYFEAIRQQLAPVAASAGWAPGG